MAKKNFSKGINQKFLAGAKEEDPVSIEEPKTAYPVPERNEKTEKTEIMAPPVREKEPEPVKETVPVMEPETNEKSVRNVTKKLGRKKTRKDGDKQLSLYVDEDIYEWIVGSLKYGDSISAFVNNELRKAMESSAI